MLKKSFFLILFFLLPIFFLFAETSFSEINLKFPYKNNNKPLPPKELNIFKKAYPDLVFDIAYSTEYEDWKIRVSVPEKKKSRIFYWNNGSLIPESELKNKDKYRPILYKYDKDIFDPSLMTDEQKKQLKEFTSVENRKTSTGTAMFFFDFIYDGNSQKVIEDHVVNTTFLGHKTRVHERILSQLKEVEKEIYLESEKDEIIKKFISNIKSTDAYTWRQIAGTNRKSFHSLGVAQDILPAKYRGEMFWSWTKDKNPENWMLTPLAQRWMPPQKVIKIFERNGFIWGGKWAIWDNMHFEYRPELLLYSKE